MKKKKSIIILILLLCGVLIGTGLMLYPLFSEWYTQKVQADIQTVYQESVEQFDNDELNTAREVAQRYNYKLRTVQFKVNAVVEDYEDLLNLSGNGVMGSVEIPAIDVDLPIYHTVHDNVLQKGAGHMKGSSLPIGGASTHAVISAHSGMAGAKMFTDLDKLEEGDLFFLHVLGETLAYEVDLIQITTPSDIDAIRIAEGEDYVTLLTCTPYGVNTHRLLVRGRRVELTAEEIQAEETNVEQEPSTWKHKYLEAILLGAAIAIAILLCMGILFLILRGKKDENRK